MHFSGCAPFDNFVGALLDQFWEAMGQLWRTLPILPKTVERLAAAVWPALPALRPNEDLQRMGISEEVFWHIFFPPQLLHHVASDEPGIIWNKS